MQKENFLVQNGIFAYLQYPQYLPLSTVSTISPPGVQDTDAGGLHRGGGGGHQGQALLPAHGHSRPRRVLRKLIFETFIYSSSKLL